MKNALLVFKEQGSGSERKRDFQLWFSVFAHNFGMWIHETCKANREIAFGFLVAIRSELIGQPGERCSAKPLEGSGQTTLTVMSATPNNYQFNFTFADTLLLRAI